MATEGKTKITVATVVNAPVEKVWNHWVDPKHIVCWNNASDDWHTPRVENDLRVGGKFLSRMEAKDGSVGFDFTGEYNRVQVFEQIDYTMSDGREVRISFSFRNGQTTVKETFDAEQLNPSEMQRAGWQSILDNFKRYVEASREMEKLHFEIVVNAGAEKVYKAMLDDQNWREWTAVFNPLSHFKGSWEKGSKILFLGTDRDGTEGGMVSRIRENIPNRFISIEHVGIVQNGQEIMSGPEVDEWAGALENYSFTEENGKTLLSVETDSNGNFIAYFRETWPKALELLKTICER
ncbi:MAG: SRPBCC family protein [Prolixibacteraceae bacterium]|nr:SRPBCC family protein [Prolixibacteraceae bacterium]